MIRLLKSAGAFLAVVSSVAFGQGKIGGIMFGDYYYNVARNASLPGTSASVSAAPGGTAMQAFQFRRIYFTYDNDISEKFTSRFRLEADQAVLASGKITTFVKDAFLRWKTIFGSSDLFFGIQPTPAFEVSEAAWGYRSLEKTIMDLRGIVNSRDFGASLKGKLTEDGVFSYWAMVANGAGTGNVENDKSKRFYAHVHIKLSQSLQATVNIDYAARPDANNPYQPGTRVGNGMMTVSGFAGYTQGQLNAGAEAFVQSTSNGYDDGTELATKTGFGFSLFGSYNLQSEMAVVTRYDYFDPNTDTKTAAYGDKRHYIVAGFSWRPDKNVSIIPNVLYETYETPPSTNVAIDPSVTARVTLQYIFI
ncbi:MAG: hypothetical protein HY562_07330 [Ignavibacteriales bacterium]|nr:hypothetical protein [Ignavibacteriales bacterium]